uniref:Pentatricopeptide repeat-containing protein n=1 Tax=Populus davidiana TaxID=266767 RepID=A0A6M2FAG3_9ROSI
MATFKLPKPYLSPPKTLCAFSTWYSPPPQPPPRQSPPPSGHESPILTTISEAIKNIETKPLHISLKNILPSFKAHHFISLVNQNPYFLPPKSLLSFFDFLSSYPTFSHTVQSYCSMVHFLIAHRMNQQAESLLHFVVSRKGKGSASSVFASILETKG